MIVLCEFLPLFLCNNQYEGNYDEVVMIQEDKIKEMYYSMIANNPKFAQFVEDNKERNTEEILKHYNVHVFEQKPTKQKNR